jgi:transcription termination/antitermination protein NusA
MRSEFEVAFNEIAELRSLPRETVLEALRTALISAYRRDAGVGASQRVEANIDPGTGRARILVEKEVVDSVQDSRTEVELEKARYYDPEANLGDMVMVQAEGTTKKFGRIAAQTAKQVILQKIREAERNSLFDEFVEREGDLVTGTVQSVNSNVVTLSLGRAEAIMPRNQQIPGEKYKQHEKVRSYIVEVKKSSRGPQIIVSRSHRNMLRRLLEYEVPEIYNGQVEIKSIAREAGQRSKVAVAALQDGIDPVGACVGMRGIRIQNIVKELHDEKIDVIEWNTKSEVFIEKALSPARVSGVYLEEDPDNGRTAVVIVPDDQLSLAIGREGQNARLAAKLTGWRIDIKSVTEAVQEALENINGPALRQVHTDQAEMLVEIQRILDKRTANRAVMPEEYQTLGRFADIVQRRMMAAREVARQVRVEEINAVKATLPPAAFQTPVSALDVPKEVLEALQPLENVGEIMWRFLIDEKRLRQMLSDCPPDSLSKLQAALDRLVLPEYEAPPQPVEDAVPVEEASAPAPAEQVVGGEEAVPEAFADEPFVAGRPVRKPDRPAPAAQPTAVVAPPAGAVATPEEGFADEDADMDLLMTKEEKPGKKKKKERQQRRQLIFDDDRGEMVVKRRRKGGRGEGEWEEWEE